MSAIFLRGSRTAVHRCLRHLRPSVIAIAPTTAASRYFSRTPGATRSMQRLMFHHQSPRLSASHRGALSSEAPQSFPAWFVRGGTSNGLFIHRDHLPPQDQWRDILAPAMGSPDSYGRQLNGMGSGVSSTSKVMVLASPANPEVADVDYTFVQVGIRDGALDMAGNCGNMSSAVGPIALDWGIVSPDSLTVVEEDGEIWATVRLFNTNTSKVLLSRFKVAGDPFVYSHAGDYSIDGVPGTGSKITMSFLDPAGAKTGKMLPTGNPVDKLQLSDGSTVKASLVDVSNPGVFVTTSDLGLSEAETSQLSPASVEANSALKVRLEDIRRAGAAKMGMNPDVESVPKVIMLLSSPQLPDVDIQCQALSMGQAHKAVPLTLALCLGAATQVPGTLPADVVGALSKSAVVIGHPSGKLEIGTTFEDGKIVSAELLRTARVLMKGDVQY